MLGDLSHKAWDEKNGRFAVYENVWGNVAILKDDGSFQNCNIFVTVSK